MPTESLTPEQEESLELWGAEWRSLARGTAPADRPRAERAIAGLYRAAGKPPPLFMWVESPLAALLARGLLSAADVEGPLPDGSAGSWLPAPQATLFEAFTTSTWPPRPERGLVGEVHHQVACAVHDRIDGVLVRPLRSQDASEQIWATAIDWLRGWPRGELRPRAWEDTWRRLCAGWQQECRDARLRDLVNERGAADAARARALAAIDAISQQMRIYEERWSAELWLGRAYLELPEIARFAFCLRAFGIRSSVKSRRQLFWLEELARSCGWWWPGERACVLCERPKALHVDDRGRIHHPSRAAIEFRDGFDVYLWRGVGVSPSWILEPASIKPEGALDPYANSEKRRVITEIVGWTRIVELLQPRVIDTDPDPAIGELLEVELPPEPINMDTIDWSVTGALAPPPPRLARFLKVRCGTGREFMLSVPRDLRTAREANAWTYGLGPTEYDLEVRT